MGATPAAPAAPDVAHGGGLKHPGVLAWLRLARVFSKLERASQDQLREFGLSGAQFDVLAQVGVRDGCTQQALADMLLVTKGNITQLLDRMERAGWLTRSPDGRIKRVRLTEAGRELRARAVPAHEAYMASRMTALSPREQRSLLALLRTLDRDLEP